MRRDCLGMIALVVIGAALLLVVTHQRTAYPIYVAVHDADGGGSVALPCVNGYVSGCALRSDGTRNEETVKGSYKVVEFPARHFTILAHYVIIRNGTSAEYDRVLPVRNQRPAKTDWINLDKDIGAFAYIGDGSIRY